MCHNGERALLNSWLQEYSVLLCQSHHSSSQSETFLFPILNTTPLLKSCNWKCTQLPNSTDCDEYFSDSGIWCRCQERWDPVCFIYLCVHLFYLFQCGHHGPPDIHTSLPKDCICSRWDPLTNLCRGSGPWENTICHASSWACAGRLERQQAGHRRQGRWFLRVIFCNFSSADDTLGLLVTNLIVAPLCWLSFLFFLCASGSMLDSTAVIVSP